MGQLRSTLSAASRAADGPARALEVLALYARCVDRAQNTTVAAAVSRIRRGFSRAVSARLV